MKGNTFIYLLPAILCCMAVLCGFIPSIFCLDGHIFGVVSIAVFLLSLVLHAYILIKWRTFANHSPFAYAIVQPCNHFIILCFALAVGGTSLCNKPAEKTPTDVKLEVFNINPKKFG